MTPEGFLSVTEACVQQRLVQQLPALLILVVSYCTLPLLSLLLLLLLLLQDQHAA
jgi:hypothetical protein